MPAKAADPRLLVPRGRLEPAAAVLGDLCGTPTAISFEGDPGAWEELERAGPADRRRVAHLLRHAVALTIAVVPRRSSPLPDWLARSFDMVASTMDQARQWSYAFDRAPEACLAATLLARRDGDDTWDGLVAESTTYSLLQASEEFRRWIAGRGAAGPQLEEDGSPRVRVERRGGTCRVTLSRPARHNALDRRMRDELHAALDPLRQQAEVRVTIRGEGPSFCSGGDLSEFGTFPSPMAAHAIRLHRSLALVFAELGPRMVAALHGSCLGAGIELPAFAAHVLAAEDARIGLPEGSLGLIPGAGGTVSIRRRAGRARLLQLLVTGEAIDAATALDWGLVDEVLPASELDARASELASDVRGGAA